MLLPQDPAHGLSHDGTHGSTVATSRGDRRALSTFPRTAGARSIQPIPCYGTWKDRSDNGWNNSITLRDCTIQGNGLYTIPMC
jgi:hypothetical protein